MTIFSNENSYFWVEIAIENDLKFSARREKRMVALQSLLITELNHLFIIMNDMNSDDNLSKEDVNHAISLMRHCQTVTGRQSMGVDLGPAAQNSGTRIVSRRRYGKSCC